MGPENMKEGEDYIAVLQKDGTISEWQKWNGLKKVELRQEFTIRELVNSLSDIQKYILNYLLGKVFKNGCLSFGDKLWYHAVTYDMNKTQSDAIDILIGAARKEWKAKHGTEE